MTMGNLAYKMENYRTDPASGNVFKEPRNGIFPPTETSNHSSVRFFFVHAM